MGPNSIARPHRRTTDRVDSPRGGSKPMVPFWGRCTTQFRTYFSGDWAVHWGYDLGFDPWPCVTVMSHAVPLPCREREERGSVLHPLPASLS